MIHRVATSGTTIDNEWQRMTLNKLNELRRTLKQTCWIKSRHKPLTRNINSKKQELRQFFCLRYMQLQKSMKIARHKHNVVISSSTCSGHPDKYSNDSPGIHSSFTFSQELPFHKIVLFKTANFWHLTPLSVLSVYHLVIKPTNTF